MTNNYLYNLFFQKNTSFYIYGTLILECYMKFILEQYFKQLRKVKVLKRGSTDFPKTMKHLKNLVLRRVKYIKFIT